MCAGTCTNVGGAVACTCVVDDPSGDMGDPRGEHGGLSGWNRGLPWSASRSELKSASRSGPSRGPSVGSSGWRAQKLVLSSSSRLPTSWGVRVPAAGFVLVAASYSARRESSMRLVLLHIGLFVSLSVVLVDDMRSEFVSSISSCALILFVNCQAGFLPYILLPQIL